MIMSSWTIECPVCDHTMWGDTELSNEELECPDCGSILDVSTAIEWDTSVEVKEEHHNDCDEDDE